jgi:hypothetical protein
MPYKVNCLQLWELVALYSQCYKLFVVDVTYLSLI